MTPSEANEIRDKVRELFGKAAFIKDLIAIQKAKVVELVSAGDAQGAREAQEEVEALTAVLEDTAGRRTHDLLEFAASAQEIDALTVSAAESHAYKLYFGPSNLARMQIAAAELRPYSGPAGGLIAEFECPLEICRGHLHRVGVPDPMPTWHRVFAECGSHGPRPFILIDAAGLRP
jgi:hypothetical protein